MAGGGGGPGPTEPGFLDMPTFTLAALLAFFLVCSLAFEKGTRWLIYFLKKRKRNGLAQAVSNLVLELTLVGLVSLVLIVLQEQIASICVPYTNGPYSDWSLIGNVRGCDCCLTNTRTIGSCFRQSRQCGPGDCNCGGQDPSCAVEQASLEEVFDEWEADGQCNSTCVQQYLARAEASPQAYAGKSALELECQGMVDMGKDKCGEGKAPLITITALHQIHIFIFVVALTHVLLGIVMVLLSSWRVHKWRKLCADEDDEHAKAVRRLLDAEEASQAPAPAPPRWRRLVRSLTGSFSQQWRTPTSGRSPSASLGSLGSIEVVRLASTPMEAMLAPVAEGASEAEEGSSVRSEKRSEAMGSAGSAAAELPAGAAGAAAGKPSSGQQQSSPAAAGAAGAEGAAITATAAGGGQGMGEEQQQQPRPLLLQQSDSGASEAVEYSAISILAPVASRHLDGSMLPEVLPAAEQRWEERSGGKVAPGGPGRVASLTRSDTIQDSDYVGWAREYALCLLLQFNPVPVATEDVRLMRAAFMLTHRVPAGFDFWGYINNSMEDDFAHIVGVSEEMWVTMVLFLLISGPMGWAAMLFLVLASLVLVVSNVKLFSIIRHVCRGYRVKQLSSNIFWFQRPDLLLHPIKYVLFLCSFLIGSMIFFLWSFGAASCPFTASGNRFWFAWVLPWWTVLIFSALIFLDAATRTLPCYSLAVQMGSEFKHHMLPQGIKARLLLISERIKKKHKAEEAARKASGVVEGGK